MKTSLMSQITFFFVTLFFLTLFPSAKSFSQTHALEAGQVYRGEETVNEKFTGNVCYITVSDVEPSSKGMHCHLAKVRFSTLTKTGVEEMELSVVTRVTNYHREEYPSIKTCAMSEDGATFRDDIYGEDTSSIMNQLFGGSFKKGFNQFHYFLTLSPADRLASRFRVHALKPWSETNFDCVNLHLMP